jgi:predicted RNase H-related nuclease YkuK (DUF458 family)
VFFLHHSQKSVTIHRRFFKKKGFLWTYMVKKVPNVNKLRDRIVRAEQCVANEMFAGTWPGSEHRLVCRESYGAHIEIY